MGVDLGDQAKQDQLVGEAYFIRGYLFHHLARNHGRIALVLGVNPDFEIGLATQEEVYSQIESDYFNCRILIACTKYHRSHSSEFRDSKSFSC